MRQPKQQGGLGIQDLDIQNKYLLRKWLYKLCNEEGLWQDLLRNKYLKHRTLSQTSKKNGEFTFLVKPDGVKDQFLNLGRFKLVSGNQIRFWEDKW